MVDFDEQPAEELYANFGSEGAEVVFYGDNIAVNISGIWIEFEPCETSDSDNNRDGVWQAQMNFMSDV